MTKPNPPAELAKVPIDLPPVVKVGDPGHVDAHNKLRGAIEKVNENTPSSADLTAVAGQAKTAGEKADVAAGQAKAAGEKADAAAKAAAAAAPLNSPAFTGTPTAPDAVQPGGILPMGQADARYQTRIDPLYLFKPAFIDTGVPEANWSAGTPENGAKTFGDFYVIGNMVTIRFYVRFGTDAVFGNGPPIVMYPEGIAPVFVTDEPSLNEEGVTPAHLYCTHPKQAMFFAMCQVFGGAGMLMLGMEPLPGGGIQGKPMSKTDPFDWAPGDAFGCPGLTFPIKPYNRKATS